MRVMNNWKKIFNIIAVTVTVFTIAYVSFLFQAKNILEKKIQEATGYKTTVGKLNILPPLNIEIRDFQIQGLARADYIYISPSIPNLLFGRVALNKIKIHNPEFTFQRKEPAVIAADTKFTVPQASIPLSSPVQPKIPAEDGESFPLVIKSLKVYSGRVNFIDTTPLSGAIIFTIRDIRFFINNLFSLSGNQVSNFILKGNISWNTGEPDGKIFFQGWVNLQKKDMLATLKIEGIDAIVFYPYYSNWVDLDKARIEKAKLNFSSNIKGVDNNVDALCHLELVDIVRKVRPPAEPQQKAERITDAVLDIFKSMNQGKVVLDFTLHTKMDKPIFGFSDIRSAFEGKLMEARAGFHPQDILFMPVKLLETGVKSGKDFSNAAIDGVFALGNGIKNFFESILNKPAPGQQD